MGTQTQESDTSSQASLRVKRATRTSQATTQDNAPHPLGLINLSHINCFSCLSSRCMIATHYYDEELLFQMGLLEDIRWLFARGWMGQFIEMKDHTYRDLTLEFLSALHVEIISAA